MRSSERMMSEPPSRGVSASDKAGIAGLWHNRRAGLAGKLQDRRNLLHRTGLQEQRRCAMIEATVFDQMRRDIRRLPQRMLFANNSDEAVEKGGGGAELLMACPLPICF